MEMLSHQVKIEIGGCDDSTKFDMDDLTYDEVTFLLRIQAISQEASTYGCQPIFKIEELEEEE